MTSGLGTMLLGLENVEQLTIMPNASCSIFRAFSISLMASIFFDGTKVKRISLWATPDESDFHFGLFKNF